MRIADILLEVDDATRLSAASVRWGPELVGGDVFAVLDAVVGRLGDDLGLVAVAVDAAGGELLRDSERVEPTHAAGVEPVFGADST